MAPSDAAAATSAGPFFWALLVALLIAIGLLVAVGLRTLKLKQELLRLEADLQRALADGRAQAERLATLENLREAQATAEQVLAAGGSVVREVHKGIAAIPFNILESIPATREPSRLVRGVHDSITEGVYGALSGLNKAVGREIRKGLQEAATGRDGTSKPGAPTPASPPVIQAPIPAPDPSQVKIETRIEPKPEPPAGKRR